MSEVKLFGLVERRFYIGAMGEAKGNQCGVTSIVNVCCSCDVCSDWKLEDVRAVATRLHMPLPSDLHADEVTGTRIVRGKVGNPFQDC